MAKYGNFVYGGAKYGESRNLAYSVEPLDVVILSFSTAFLTWYSPSGVFSKIRLVRNQIGFSETSEDGVIIWEEEASVGTVSRTYFTDGVDNLNSIPIVSGRPIYYSMFLFTDQKVWVNAGKISDIVPGSHDAQKRTMDIIPKVYTSLIQSPLGITDETSPLYKFIDGMTFTYEQFLTELDLLRPTHSSDISSYLLLPIESANVGLNQEPNLPIKNQKRLIREAFYMYANKGTQSGIETYVEALSGYAPVVTVSSNILLTSQDSTFYKGIGNWTAVNAVITSSDEQVAASGTNVIDEVYSCKVVASASGAMSLGNSTPITKGIPVKPGATYTLSSQIKSPPSSGSITPSISFYDKTGTIIGTEIAGSSTSADGTWKQIEQTIRAPHKESQSINSATGDGSTITYTTYSNHTFISGTTVTITGFSTIGFNKTSATVTGVTTNTFSVAGTQTGTSTTSEAGTAVNNETDAIYAGLKLSWSAAGTYYIDQISVQLGDTVLYDEARSIDIFIEPNKTNFIMNPSFEVNVTDNWTLDGSATASQDIDVSDIAYSGTQSCKIVATDDWTFTSNTFPIKLGTYYTASGLVKTTEDLTVSFIARDSLGDVVEEIDVYPLGTFTDWSRFTATDLVGSDAVDAVTYEVVFSGGSGTFYLDCLQFERGISASEYFDGSLPSEFGAVWEGADDNSYTRLYVNKPLKVPRIGLTLDEWVPPNSMWRLRTYAGVEYTSQQV